MNLKDISDLSSSQFEKLICQVLMQQGYTVTPIELGEDVGIDIIACKDSTKYGVQVKKYISRKVNLETIYHTYGGAAFYNCTNSAIVTLGGLTDNAKMAAEKLAVEVWGKEFILNCDESVLSKVGIEENKARYEKLDWFDDIWENNIMNLKGSDIPHISRKSVISIKDVNSEGITIINSNGKERHFDIERFREILIKLKYNGSISRAEVSDDFRRRGASAICAVIAAIPNVKVSKINNGTVLIWEQVL